jgi:dTDP-4-amino-4,6-dideoxygalactose transaminase
VDIPLVDLGLQHSSLAAEITEGCERVFKDSSYILGEEVDRFESGFADFSGIKHAVAVANGTDALELCLRAASVGPGDDVLVPTNTFAATALAVVRAGARPVFVDCDPVDLLIDVEDAARRTTADSKAIIPVHLYGQMAPMDGVVELAQSSELTVVEDAAQVQGALQNGRPAGSLGLCGGTSFYPGKNLGAYGDAGAVLTNSNDIAARVRSMRNYGSARKYEHDSIGFNSRLDSIQAVVLNVKLKRLAAWNAARRVAADRYRELLQDVPTLTLPHIRPGNEHVWHLFVIRIPDRDRVLERLNAEGIGAGVHYPRPLHLQPAFRSLGYSVGDFPNAERAAAEVLSLPIFPEITQSQQERVAEVLTRALAVRARRS